MGEILGLMISDFPNLRLQPKWMSGALQGNVDRGWESTPHLKDPGNWPAPMREQWGDDRGESAGREIQAHMHEQFRLVGNAIDAFEPDFLLVMYREGTETWGNFARPQWYIQAHEQLESKLWQSFGPRENLFDEPLDRSYVVPGHRQGALHIARQLQDKGWNPLYSLEPYHPNGFGHNMVALTVHLDFERRRFNRPLVPLAVDPFGFLRDRNNEGLTPWDRDMPRPLLPREAFTLGRDLAETIKASPWKVALVAGHDWAHQNDTARTNQPLHPDHEADSRRFEEWSAGRFTDWGDSWTFNEMEEHGQWEFLIAIILAGAMTHVGARVVHADFQPTWVFNDDFVTTIFEAK